MRTIEDYWQDFERIGFIKTEYPARIDYVLKPELGSGGFSILGNPKGAMGAISDVTLNKPIIIQEGIDENCFEFGEYYTGAASFYSKKSHQTKFPHGLFAYANQPKFIGYKRVEAGVRLVSVAFCYRQQFFDELTFSLPKDFWQVCSQLVMLKPINAPELAHICQQLYKCKLKGDALNMYIHGKALEGLAHFIDYVYSNKEKPTVKLTTEDKIILEKIRILLEKKYANPPTIKQLTKLFPINQQKLITGFKSLYDMTILNYTQKIRMTKAIDYLKHEQLAIADIAKTVGYYGDGHFQKLFKKTYGITPYQMRNELKISPLNSFVKSHRLTTL